MLLTVEIDAQPRVQPDPPVQAFYLAIVSGGGPVNLVLLGVRACRRALDEFAREFGGARTMYPHPVNVRAMR